MILPFLSNEIVFVLQSVSMAAFAVMALHHGKTGLVTFISTCWLLANLCVLKEAMLFGLEVTVADSFTIGANSALILLQRYYQSKDINNALWIGFYSSLFFLVVCVFHNLYLPSAHDTTHLHYLALFGRMPRVIASSFFIALISSMLNVYVFKKMSSFFQESYYGIPSFIALSVAQITDTVLFAFCALYGTVDSLTDIILFSSFIKIISITIHVPCIEFMSNFIKQPAKE